MLRDRNVVPMQASMFIARKLSFIEIRFKIQNNGKQFLSERFEGNDSAKDLFLLPFLTFG